MRTSLLRVLSRQAATEARAGERDSWRPAVERAQIDECISQGRASARTSRLSGPQSMLEALDPDITEEWALRNGPARWHVTGRGPLVGVREHQPLNAYVRPWVTRTGDKAVLVPRSLIEAEGSLAWCREHSLISRADEGRFDAKAVPRSLWASRLRPAALWIPELHGSRRLADAAGWQRAVRAQESMVAAERECLQVAVTATHALRLASRAAIAETLGVTPTRVSQIKRTQAVTAREATLLLEQLGLASAPRLELSTLRERAADNPLVGRVIKRFDVVRDPLQPVRAASSFLRLRECELRDLRALRDGAIRSAVTARADDPPSIPPPVSHRRIAALLEVDVSWVHRAAARAH